MLLGRCLSNALCRIINIQHQPTVINCTNAQTHTNVCAKLNKRYKTKIILLRYYSLRSQDRIDVNENVNV